MSDDVDQTPELPDDVVVLKAIIGEQELRIAVLEEKLRLATYKRFGASSEKAEADQLGLFNEAETIATTPPTGSDTDAEITVHEHKRKKGGRRPLADELPRVHSEHDITDAEKLCPCGSGHARPPIGEVVTEQADIVPARIQVLQHVRFKYGCCRQCDGVFPQVASVADSDGCGEADTTEPRAIVVAPLPAQPIPKSIASPNTCAFVTTAKYADGMPLYRLEKILARYGLDVSRGTLAAWMIRLGEMIVPLMNLMEETQLGYDVQQMDETTVQVLKDSWRPVCRRAGRPSRTSPHLSRMGARKGASLTAVRLFGVPLCQQYQSAI